MQDDHDVLESGRFYDPNRPSGAFAAFPRYPGLMDRAQLPFQAAGLAKPSYVAFGNHDGTVQGSLHALQALLLAHPHVIAYVAGHTHDNRVTAFERSAGGGFWGIETASEIDWPIQSRLLQVMDNRDGTLSIFGTLIDHGATLVTPRPGTPAVDFGPHTLAALGRELAFNDPQAGVEAGAAGRAQDRNVELLLPDPRGRGG